MFLRSEWGNLTPITDIWTSRPSGTNTRILPSNRWTLTVGWQSGGDQDRTHALPEPRQTRVILGCGRCRLYGKAIQSVGTEGLASTPTVHDR